MGAAVQIARLDLDAAGLRRAAARTRDGAASRRMLALALVLEGASRTDAARVAGMDRQTLRDWCTATTSKGWRDCRPAGRGRAQAVPLGRARDRSCRMGPTWAGSGHARGRALAPGRPGPGDRGQVRCRLGRAQHERRAAAAWFPRLAARPRHPGQDPAAQASFRPTPRPRRRGLARARPRQAAGTLVADAMRADTAWADRPS